MCIRQCYVNMMTVIKRVIPGERVCVCTNVAASTCELTQVRNLSLVSQGRLFGLVHFMHAVVSALIINFLAHTALQHRKPKYKTTNTLQLAHIG